VGLLPFLFLAPSAAGEVPSGLECSLVRQRGDSPVLVAAALDHLINDVRLGRAFVRYPAALAAELQCSGALTPATTVNVSRGGLLLRTEHLPTLGTRVGVLLKLPDSSAPVEATGRVVRLAPPSATETAVEIALEITSFSADSEARFIAFLTALYRAALPG